MVMLTAALIMLRYWADFQQEERQMMHMSPACRTCHRTAAQQPDSLSRQHNSNSWLYTKNVVWHWCTAASKVASGKTIETFETRCHHAGRANQLGVLRVGLDCNQGSS